MGATSSSINDIGNDDFIPILHIEDMQQDENNPLNLIIKKTYQNSQNEGKIQPIPKIKTSTSDTSISNKWDLLNSNDTIEEKLLVPEVMTNKNIFAMKSSGSDVSISFFLDRDHINDTYDEQTFANVNANVAYIEQKRKKSDSNVTFQLDKLS